jgi:uncharacterized protein YndB with AHSA1/START domain
MTNVTQHGYLVLADISGYTSFVAKTELEHSHEILTELLELLVEKFNALMTISKLEGDAVFAYVDEAKLTRGETLIEFMESMYVSFRDKQVSMRRKTTCTCSACQNITTLDLKFIAHHGDYIIQTVTNIHELLGSDVNLIHRLLKNHLAESTGWRAYMMLTENCLDHLNLRFENAHVQIEEYEHLGSIKTFNIDLHARYKEITEARRIMISEEEADLITSVDFHAPPHIVWEWLQDPAKRNLWSPGVTWSAGDRPRGRAGVGASNHCAHGKGVSTEVTADWRPFEYSTVDSFDNGKRLFTETARLEELPDGVTRLKDLVRIRRISKPAFVRRFMAWFMFIALNKYDKALHHAARLAKEDYERTQSSTNRSSFRTPDSPTNPPPLL